VPLTVLVSPAVGKLTNAQVRDAFTHHNPYSQDKNKQALPQGGGEGSSEGDSVPRYGGVVRHGIRL